MHKCQTKKKRMKESRQDSSPAGPEKKGTAACGWWNRWEPRLAFGCRGRVAEGVAGGREKEARGGSRTLVAGWAARAVELSCTQVAGEACVVLLVRAVGLSFGALWTRRVD
jgi:hypothetical protein